MLYPEQSGHLPNAQSQTPILSTERPPHLGRYTASLTSPVAVIRSSLHHALMNEASSPCCCASLPDLAAVPMGGDGLDERVFATIENVADHGGDAWWLKLSQCRACGQHWMIAQEERIFDEYFLRRLTIEEADRISIRAEWPVEFLSYERVLKAGHALHVRPCIFLERLSPSLVWTAEDLRKERPDISVNEIAVLLGITETDAKRLLASASSGQGSWRQRMRHRVGL